jgi:hypothetical protein
MALRNLSAITQSVTCLIRTPTQGTRANDAI